MFYRPPEPVFAALFALVESLAGFVTISRRWRHWADVPAELQPCLFQVEPPGQTIQYQWRANGAPIITAKAEFVIYCREEDASQPTSPQLNALIANIFAALEPPPYESSGRLQLFDANGNLIAYHARIDGEVNVIEGVTTDQAQGVAYIPVEILVSG